MNTMKSTKYFQKESLKSKIFKGNNNNKDNLEEDIEEVELNKDNNNKNEKVQNNMERMEEDIKSRKKNRKINENIIKKINREELSNYLQGKNKHIDP